MSDAPKLEARGVGKNFGSLRAVSGVSMKVAHGELRAIIGPNGAGKTTFFNLITGFFPPSAGEILLDGQNINRVAAAERVKMGMGRTFQITEIFPELTVWENARIAVETGIGFSLRAWLSAAEKRRVADAVDEVLTMANITAQSDRLVGELSHGDQRAAEIAMALALKPSLLLLDEPTAGIGDEETYQVTGLIRRLPRDSKYTIVLIEH
ncbi:MAG: ABC transporter ATP-binding protein, partial [Rhodospirillaceae bacterium]